MGGGGGGGGMGTRGGNNHNGSKEGMIPLPLPPPPPLPMMMMGGSPSSRKYGPSGIEGGGTTTTIGGSPEPSLSPSSTEQGRDRGIPSFSFPATTFYCNFYCFPL